MYRKGFAGFARGMRGLGDANSYWVAANYQAVLGRQPDAGGGQGWYNQMQGGLSQQALTQAFLNSGEYCGKFGLPANCNTPNPQFLTQLYQSAFGRAPDTAGYNFYISALGDSNLQQAPIVGDFIASAEFKNDWDPQLNAWVPGSTIGPFVLGGAAPATPAPTTVDDSTGATLPVQNTMVPVTSNPVIPATPPPPPTPAQILSPGAFTPTPTTSLASQAANYAAVINPSPAYVAQAVQNSVPGVTPAQVATAVQQATGTSPATAAAAAGTAAAASPTTPAGTTAAAASGSFDIGSWFNGSTNGIPNWGIAAAGVLLLLVVVK